MKKLLAFLLLAAMAAGVCGCAPSGAPGESESESASQSEAVTPKLAICMSYINHPVHRVVQLGFIEGAKAEGLETPLISGLDDGYTAELQDKWDKDIKGNGIKGICLWTSGDSEYKLMNKWHDAGVKVVVPYYSHNYDDTKEFIDANVFGSGWPQSSNEDYFGVDVGASAADLILSRLAEKGIASGRIGVTATSWNGGNYEAYERFCERIKQSGANFTVIDLRVEGAEKEEAAKIVTWHIAKYPDMVAAFGTTGGSARAWSNAKKNTGRDDIIVVGHDYIEQNLAILEEGGVDGLVARPLYGSAYKSAQVLNELLGVDYSKEDSWRVIVGEPIITLDGEGINGAAYYEDMFTRMHEYFGE